MSKKKRRYPPTQEELAAYRRLWHDMVDDSKEVMPDANASPSTNETPGAASGEQHAIDFEEPPF